MKLKYPTHPAHRRKLLRSALNAGIDQPSRKALGSLMRGYKRRRRQTFDRHEARTARASGAREIG